MSTITVFKDMVLQGSAESRDSLVSALKAEVTAPWRFDPEGSADAARTALGPADIMIFERAKDLSLPAARLVLWPKERGFYVPNVVPTSAHELTVAEYNSVLSEFADAVAWPIARRFGWSVGMTSAEQGLADWLPTGAADALKRFSAAANKSTGASHPMDERRWFDFIIAVHRLGGDIGTDRLVRWLHEAEGWDETNAHDLASEYERGLALLRREAETR